MSEKSIYLILRKGGLSTAGACAVMGNMYCESLLQSNNVENRCPISDQEYTKLVDAGGYDFERDNGGYYGYGLCQWTYYTRKRELLAFARSKGVSIANEAMQVEFCLKELKRDNSGLYSYLCVAEDLFTAVSRFCKEYERPAVNNVYDRYEAAQKYFARYSNLDISTEIPEEETPEQQPAYQIQPVDGTESTEICVRILGYGCKGRDVFMLQCGLTDAGFSCGVPDGEFFSKTRNAVKEMQTACNLEATGIAGQDVWQVLFQ